MRGKSSLWVAAFAAGVGCSVALELPGSAQVLCDEETPCPEGLVCAEGVGRCVPDVADNERPQLLAVNALGPTTVRLSFDEPLAPGSAQATANYTFAPELSIIEAELDEDGQTVDLTVNVMRAGESYTIEVAGVSDWRGNTVADETSGAFIGYGTPPDTAPPSIVVPAQDSVVRMGGVLFAWTAPEGAESYTLEVARDPNFEEHVSESPLTTSNTTAVLSVNDGAYTFYWRVTADVTEGVSPVHSFEVIDGSIRVYCAPEDDCAESEDILESGNLSHPFRSVGRALSASQQLAVDYIYIASRGGSLAYNESVNVPGGSVIVGGFKSDFSGSVDDLDADPTILANASEPPITIGLTPSYTSLTYLTVRTDGGVSAMQVVGASGNLFVEHCQFVTAPGFDGPPIVSFESTGGARFANNTIYSEDAQVGLSLSTSSVTVQTNHIELGPYGTGYQRVGVYVIFGGNAEVKDNVILAREGSEVIGLNVAYSGRATASDNLMVADGAGSAVYGINVDFSATGTFERNRVFVRGRGIGTEGMGLSADQVLGVMFLSNLVDVQGGPSVLAARVANSDSFVQLIGNSLLVGPGGRGIFAYRSQPVIVNNIIGSLSTTGSTQGVFEGENSRPMSLLNNLIFNVQDAYLVNGSPTDPTTLDDPSGAQGTWARIQNNLLPAAASLTPADLFVDVDGPDDDLDTWEDNNYHLLLSTDGLGITTGGLDVSDAAALPPCYAYNVESLSCSQVQSDVAGTSRTAPLSIGAYEKD